MSLRLGSRTCLARLSPRAPPSLPGPRPSQARLLPRSTSRRLGPRSCSARSTPRSTSRRLGPRSCSARSAPRAHVRELLCETQSSKEQLRRSRTESSGAAPAIEELAGEARQVRPAGPRADKYQSGPDFSPAGRSGGRQALQLPRASNSRGSSISHLPPDRAPQKSEIPVSVPASPIYEKPRRASGPPAPASIKF